MIFLSQKSHGVVSFMSVANLYDFLSGCFCLGRESFQRKSSIIDTSDVVMHVGPLWLKHDNWDP